VGGIVVQTGATGANGRILVSPTSGMVSSITLTFDNANGAPLTAGVESGSLADGRWQLAIPPLGYQSPLNDPSLRRLYGDNNNDGNRRRPPTSASSATPSGRPSPIRRSISTTTAPSTAPTSASSANRFGQTL